MPSGAPEAHPRSPLRPLSFPQPSPPSRSGALLRRLRRRHDKTFIALRRDVVADLAIDADAADIGHEDLRFAGNVGAHVPGIGLRIERGMGDLVDMRHPS